MAAVKTRWNDLPAYLRLEVTELYHNDSDPRLRQVFQDCGITVDHLGVFPPERAIMLRAKKIQNERALEWRYAILHCLHHHLTGYELSPPDPPKPKRPRDSRIVTLERQRKLEENRNAEASCQGGESTHSLPFSTESVRNTDEMNNISEPLIRWLDE